MRISLVYGWDCTPEAFWTLYFDPEFVVRLHLEGLGSTSAEVVSQEGDLSSGLVRALRYGQRPNAPGPVGKWVHMGRVNSLDVALKTVIVARCASPVRKIFGDEITATEVSTYDPATSRVTFTVTPGTMPDKTHIVGSIAVSRESGSTVETFSLDARVKIFGVGPIVERFVEARARDMQEKSVAFMRAELDG
jgi:hypothetical protein